jgi:16S rRNA (cytidine1402-2'-O)-methyltransferase
LSGVIYLIPSPLAENSEKILSGMTADLLSSLDLFFVETPKNSRRFIKSVCPELKIEDLDFIVIGKHSNSEDWKAGLEKVWMGKNAGVLSDAGLPGVGDPGFELISEAHATGVKVIPIAGPNSFLMALMASGLNGQNFRFHGYLPIDKGERRKALRQMDSDIKKSKESQIFMETPYRNQQLLDTILNDVSSINRLCLAIDISGKDEEILTLGISDWKKMEKKMPKLPAVFILGA